MAPKGGKGGGSSGGSSGGFSSSSCPRAFKSDSEIYAMPVETFVAYVLLWFAFLCLIIGRSKAFKKHPKAKILIGPMFSASVWLAFISYSLLIVSSLLRECDTTPFYTFYYWVIFVDLLFYIAQFLLLVLVFYALNALLRAQLGTTPAYFRILNIALLSIMGVLTVALLGLQIYSYVVILIRSSSGQRLKFVGDELVQLRVAYFVLYLVTVVVGGALAIKTILAMRARSLPTSNLLTKTILLIISMTLWLLFTIIEWGSVLPDSESFDRTVYVAFMYIEYIFQIASWTLLLYIAKSSVLKGNADTTTAPIGTDTSIYPNDAVSQVGYTAPQFPQQHQQQYHQPQQHYQQQQPTMLQQPQYQGQQPHMYAYPVQPNMNGGGQQYYYTQQPVYSSGVSPANGNLNGGAVPVNNAGSGGYMVQVK